MHQIRGTGEVSVGRGVSPWWWGGVLLLALGCGDDSPANPEDTGSTTDGGSTTATVTTAVEMSTTTTTTGLDSTGMGTDTGSTGTTASVDSTGTSEGSSSTGEPNLGPEAADDVYFVRQDEAPLMIDAAAGVLANDSDPEADPLMVDSADAASAAGGTVSVQADGSFTYTPPAPDFFGDDSFGYTVVDGAGGTASGLVRVTVGPVEIALSQVSGGTGGFVIDGSEVNGESGWSVTGGGDVNGDGLDDVVVTSTMVSGGLGRAYVVFGKADGGAVALADVDVGTGGFSIIGEMVGDQAGTDVAIVGDVDGDELADVLVGAPQAAGAGRAYLVHGKADGALVDLADVALGIGGFLLEGDDFGEDAGAAVAGVGDVNGDGLADLAVGAPDGGPIPSGGRTYVVFGKADTSAVMLADVFAGIGGFTARGSGFDDVSGSSVAGPGDVNGDGLDDVLVGAPDADAGGSGDSGRCYVVFGKQDGALVDLGALGSGGYRIDGAETSDLACTAVGGAGDMNGDGLADLVVGAPQAENDVVIQGRVYLLHGKADTSPVALADVAMGAGGFVIDGEAAANFLGLAVDGAGDMDGDGFSDLILGTPNVNTPGTFEGRGYAVFGKGDTAALPLVDLTVRLGGFRLLAEAAFDEVGWAVSGAGDVNGDGFADFLVGALGVDGPAGVDAGRTYVVYGGNWSGALSHAGGAGADTIPGTGGPDVIVAGAGDDIVLGEGGSDVLYGGAGDDTLAIRGGAFFRVDGGSGYDTLRFDDGDVQLDLTVVADVALRDIEVIDLTGDGDNILSLAYDDLRAAVGVSRTLRLEGDNLDAADVDLTGAGFVDMGMAGGVHTYSNGAYTLEVVEPLGAIVML